MQNAINHHATGVTVSGSKCIVKEFPVERQLTPSNSPRQGDIILPTLHLVVSQKFLIIYITIF